MTTPYADNRGPSFAEKSAGIEDFLTPRVFLPTSSASRVPPAAFEADRAAAPESPSRRTDHRFGCDDRIDDGSSVAWTTAVNNGFIFQLCTRSTVALEIVRGGCGGAGQRAVRRTSGSGGGATAVAPSVGSPCGWPN